MGDVQKEVQVERPENAGNFPIDWGSDAIAEMLRRLDLEYVSLNPGASYRGLHDSLVNYLGNESPQMLLCNHEEHAVSIAHGYAKVAGKPMGVIVHSNVGLMHATMGVFDAWCDRVPVIILGAIGPVDASRRRPWIDWIHTTKDMGALVRNFTKWDDQPGSVPAAMESLLRASQIARTAPKGPVYICLDVAMQEARLVEPVAIPDVSRYMPAPSPELSREAVRGAADLLSKAERPLVLAGRVSRSQEAWDDRVALVEALGARVMTDIKVGAAFPTDHPFHGPGPTTFLSEEAISLLQAADVILSLDWLDLAGTFKQAWGASQVSPKVIHCSVDCYSHNGWSMDHQGLPPVDVPILAEPDTVVPPLLSEIKGLLGDRDVLRPGGWGPVREDQAAPVSDTGKEAGPVTLPDLARCLKEVLGEREVTFIRLPLGWPGDACNFEGPLDYLGGDGGGGVGSGPGMAIGAALALRGSGRLPVAILGDGGYLMGANALWTAVHYHIPVLIIIANNRSYFNDEVHQERMARERDRPVENKWIGLRMDDPPVDLAAMARAQGLKGEGPIVDVKDLSDVLARAVKTVEGGEPCVIDVLVTKRASSAPAAKSKRK